LIALFLGVSTMILSLSLLSAYIKTEPAVIAVRDLRPYEQISLNDIKVVQMPVKAIPASGIRKAEDLMGAYTLSKICAGQMFLAGHIVSSDQEVGISAALPRELRAIFLPANAQRAVGGLIKPGDKIDVICARKGLGYFENGNFRGAVTVLRSARVVDVVWDESSKEFQGVVIMASAAACESIAYHLESGNIYLSLVSRFCDEPERKPEEIEAEVWPGQ